MCIRDRYDGVNLVFFDLDMLRTEINGRYSKNRKEIAKIGRYLPRKQRRKEVGITAADGAACGPAVDLGDRLGSETW